MDAELDALAFRFFKLFAQYEYALKAMGHYITRGQHGAVEPDWDAFANIHGRAIYDIQVVEVIRACDYILESPSKLQVIRDGQIDWHVVANTDRSPQALFGHLRRMRNNLYHGGKFNGRWLEPDRSRELISSALVLLEALRDNNPTVRDALAGNAA